MNVEKKPPTYEVVSQPKGHAVYRDGVPLKTPAGAVYMVPSASLAEALVNECRQQGNKPNPTAMPMMQLTATTIDITARQRPALIDQVAGYAASDLLCHRADQPEELLHRQQKLWQPVLDWCTETFDAPLRTGQGIMPIAQPPKALLSLRHAVENCNNWDLTGLKQAAEIAHSLMLGLALMKGYLTAEQIFAAAECDSLFQMDRWGEDPVTLERHRSIHKDLDACKKWFNLISSRSS